MVITKTHKDIKDVLMTPFGSGVKEPYFEICGGNEDKITVVSSGKNGDEYNKTYGYLQSYVGIEVVHCLYGQGALVLQRSGDDGHVKEFKIVSLRPGIVVEVPSGSSVVLVNTGKSYLAVLDNSGRLGSFHQTQSIKEKRGLAYYIVEKKGEIAVEKNPNYSYHPEITF